MKASIIKIGNSRGIRIPKPVFEQCGFGDEVDLEVHDHELIIRDTGKPRQGWSEAFRRMAAAGDDGAAADTDVPDSTWDEDEWEWK